VRTYILFELDGLNHTAAEAGFTRKLHAAWAAIAPRTTPRSARRSLFLAADDASHPVVRRLVDAARVRYGAVVLTSEDTRRAAPAGPHRHVALDALLCMQAAAFSGTSSSSLSGVVAAARAAGAPRLGGARGAG
ncbi:unnamed protein product, partial [Prorocentrum cordatum]